MLNYNNENRMSIMLGLMDISFSFIQISACLEKSSDINYLISFRDK